MATALSEKTSNMAYDLNFTRRIGYFFVIQSAADTNAIQQWVYVNGPNNFSAYLIVSADPSVRDAINPIEPWSIVQGNAAVTDGALAAAVNAQWNRIKTAAGQIEPV